MSEPLDIPEPSFFEKIGIRWRLFKNNTVSVSVFLNTQDILCYIE